MKNLTPLFSGSRPFIDTASVADLIRGLSHEFITPHFGKLTTDNIHRKSNLAEAVTSLGRDTDSVDIVTDMDKEIDHAAGERLPLLYPESIFMGEEGIFEGRASLDSLKVRDKVIFVGDLLDGSGNFAKGNPAFTSMIAAVYNGEVVQGWIYDVMNDSMMVAEKGAGAFLDGKRLSIDSAIAVPEASGFAAAKDFSPEYRDGVNRLSQCFRACGTIQCAGQEYLHVASGKAHFSLYEAMCPWDHMAGTLSVLEAGGVVHKWDHSAYRTGETTGGLVIAANPAIANQLASALEPKASLQSKYQP